MCCLLLIKINYDSVNNDNVRVGFDWLMVSSWLLWCRYDGDNDKVVDDLLLWLNYYVFMG